MFPQKLYWNDTTTASTIPDSKYPQFRLDDYGYGKENVRVVALVKDGPRHAIKEYNVSAHLKLATHKEYYESDNSDIIGSDVTEVNIFLHAKKHGLTTPEDYALTFTQHLLDTYPILNETHVRVEEKSWDRLNGEHNHSFTMTSSLKRSCDVVRKRNDPNPLVMCGIDGLRIVKTSQAPFVGYVKAGLHTEGDQPDRTLCADIIAKWQYSTLENVDFSTSWHQVKDLIIKSFAGDPTVGVTTTSVQFISYEANKLILTEVPQICSVLVALPNIRYMDFDFSRFAKVESNVKNLQIISPADAPNGVGYSKLDRLDFDKLNKSKI